MATSTSIGSGRPWPAARHAVLRRLLHERMDALREHRRSLRDAMPWEEVAVADKEERAVQELEVGLDVAVLEIGFQQVREIETAVRRLEAGDDGRCLDCGGLIRASRLSAHPFAVRCFGCQDAFEEKVRAQSRAMPLRGRTRWL